MKTLLTLSLLTVISFAAQDAPQDAPQDLPQDLPQAAAQLEQHAWLQRLAGEWKVTGEAIMDPAADPVTWESEESIRALGDLWIVAEGTADYEGEPFTSLMTLGYDPAKEAFVGSWVDTMQTMMWTYVGQLDESGRVLTLEAEGPSWTDPDETARYRDQIVVVGADEKKLISSVLGEDGTWTTFMTATARRVK